MSRAVLDASVLVATLVPVESHHAEAVALYAAHPPDATWLVPSVFRIEVVAALARRGESPEAQDGAYAFVRGARFEGVDVDTALADRAAGIARRARLRAYDAVYAAVAQAYGATLFTLDADLAVRLKRHVPKLRVRTE